VTLPRTIGILGIAIVISVALNLFLAGEQLGRQFRGPPPPIGFDQRLQSFTQDLPDEDQPAAREILGRRHDEIVQKWRALRSATQRATSAVHSDPFEEEEATAAFAKANQRDQDFRKVIQDTLMELASKISPEGRQRLRSPIGGL
jgi:uncharacterized membrane protein